MDFSDIWAMTPPIEVPWAPTITLVADELCPSCRKEGSPKVTDDDGTCWWKCLSTYANCKIGYWVPGTRRREMKLTPEAAAEQNARIKAQVEEQLRDTRWIHKNMAKGISQSMAIPNTDPLPEGWTEGPGGL